MNQVKHPNIVNVKEILQNKENYFVVMEYIDGGSLYDFVMN